MKQDIKRIKLVIKELEDYTFFRQHRIQGTDEPRAHCLLHERATDKKDKTQPSYKYASVLLKARPLKELPHLESLAEDAKGFFGIDEWKVGVNPVYYRDGKDHIGLHSDDDQGETLIFTAILKTSSRGRPVLVQPKRNAEGKIDDGAVRYEIWARQGDAYKMDGKS